MKKAALVTYNKLPNLNASDRLLIKPLKKRGFVPFPIPWDKKGVAWDNFDLVILRTTWDYHLRIPEFFRWLENLEEKIVNLWNPPSIIRWNMNKRYLLDLDKKGIPIIPILLVTKQNVMNIKNLLGEKKWEEIIIKPTIGASSYMIAKIRKDECNPNSPVINSILKQSDIIIQPFMEEIKKSGEFSFIFFNRKFSHAIHKTPKMNEFRTQPEFGAKEKLYNPQPYLIAQTQKILETIDSPLLYARIDGLIIHNQFYLMEMELIEPYLYFEFEKNSAEKLVEAAFELNWGL